ncbi:hypothetical protein [Piscinibacter sakaiensis]|uniref:hypothetical protein n=1 Tax=Piscinibacter sakaiensis TaxID=1547922 RepID=UPI003AAC0149
MPASWKNKPGRFKPEIILAEVDSERTVGANGKVSFVAFGSFEMSVPIIRSMLDFPDAAEHLDVSHLISRSFASAKGKLTSATFLAALNAALKRELSKLDEDFVMLTALSISVPSFPPMHTVNGAKIRLLQGDYPSRFRKSRETVLQDPRSATMEATPPTYTKVLVRIKAKSPRAAALKALDALDLLRGIWCLYCNPGFEIPLGGNPPRKPINLIRLGNQHTVHHPDGSLVSESQFWYEPNFSPAHPYTPKDASLLLKAQRDVLRRLAASPYSKRLVSAILRGTRALDESDADVAFVRLWSALESATASGIGQGDYDKVVRRCAFLYKETEYQRQVMEHLREYRNANIHSGTSSEDARLHCFQLLDFFRSLIRFHLRNRGGFKSIDEANRFLDLPSDKQELRSIVATARRALKFLG